MLISQFAQRKDCCYNVKDNVLNDRMVTTNVAIGLMLFSQVAVGILGNLSLLYHHLVLSCSESTLRSTDVILSHLMIANLLVEEFPKQ